MSANTRSNGDLPTAARSPARPTPPPGTRSRAARARRRAGSDPADRDRRRARAVRPVRRLRLVDADRARRRSRACAPRRAAVVLGRGRRDRVDLPVAGQRGAGVARQLLGRQLVVASRCCARPPRRARAARGDARPRPPSGWTTARNGPALRRLGPDQVELAQLPPRNATRIVRASVMSSAIRSSTRLPRAGAELARRDDRVLGPRRRDDQRRRRPRRRRAR